jgi:phage-related protein
MSNEKKYRKVEFHKNYFEEFFVSQNQKVKNKIIWTLELIEDVEIIPTKYLKNVDGKLYEIRVKVGSDIFRIFSFFDSGKLIILANGFQKKSNKLPKSEIRKAKKIMQEYFDSKN